MRISLALLVLGCTVFLAACGGVSAGDSCKTDGFLCAGKDTVLECRLQKWRALPCRGPNGCKVTGDEVTCDISQNREGDACAAKNEGQGICDPSGKAVLTCRNGTFVKTNDCSSCASVGELIQCNPQ